VVLFCKYKCELEVTFPMFCSCQVCWQLCSPSYLERDNPVFPDDCVYQLFRVFSMLGDMVENDLDDRIEVIFSLSLIK